MARKKPIKTPTKWYALTGRIPEQENQTLVLKARNADEAVQKFIQELYVECCESRTPEQVKKSYGYAICLDACVSSSEKIKHEIPTDW